MDLQNLRALLITEGFRSDAYDLGDTRGASETYALRKRDGAWVTFYAEHGRENSLARFATLAEASEELLRRLRNDPSTR
jgi:hypothetical protein